MTSVGSSFNGVVHYKSKQDFMDSRALNRDVKEIASKASDAVKPEISNAKKKLTSEVLSKGLKNLKPAVDMAKNIAGGKVAGSAENEKESKQKMEELEKARALDKAAELEKTNEAEKTNKVKKRTKLSDKPMVFVFKGFELFSNAENDGLQQLSDHVKGSKVFNWSDEDIAFEEIKKHSLSAPLVLIGHSLGGDTAVNISQRLNNLENGYRKVDLLVTLDSVGLNNDIVPTNVNTNLNFISDEGGIFNDGPNIARDTEETDVTNFLRPEDHQEIDNSNPIQKKIYDSVAEVLGDEIQKF
ncbi:MAG: hypothetical protein ACPGJV_06215 [Bacteriovoracaceae bacterium]